MASRKRKEPDSASVEQGSSKQLKPSIPLQKPGSKTDANGGGLRNADNDFFNDEEAWIKIYYTLLSRQAAQQVAMPIPPTTEILLLFNAYFQGFKEPIGKASLNWDESNWLLECVAAPTRTRRNLVDFETAAQRVCPQLKAQVDGLREQRPAYVDEDDAPADASSLFVTPEQIASVLQEAGKVDPDGNPVTTALDNLTLPDPTPADTDPWKNKAVTHINARETKVTGDNPRWLDYKPRHWNPEGIPARSLRPGPQMVNRHEHAAYANAIINACPVPLLGFFGDLRKLKAEDFSGDFYNEPERSIEQTKAKEQVRIVQLSRKVIQARMLLADCKDKYGALDKSFSVGEVIEMLEEHTVEEVEAFYRENALALNSL